MIMDDRLEFADAVSVVNAAGTFLIGDVIDLGLAPRDVGNGEEMFFAITVDTEIITAGTAGTIKFQLVSDAQAAILTDGSASVHADSGTYVTGSAAANDPLLNAGAITYFVALPIQGRVYERYLGVLATIGTTAVTAGKINAFLTMDKTGWRAYQKAAF